MKIKVVVLLLVLLGGMVPVSRACMWDSTTLWTEKRRHPDLAKTVLGEPEKAEPAGPLRERIEKLTKERRENEPMWWNDLAVAHMKLGELKEAVALLESVTNRFANDYGIHANLGTAYHLMGRYQEAEKEIARDLEINPDAHFGLEKYHLALLQYLVRDEAYKSRHVYVDEFTVPFLESRTRSLGRSAVDEGVVKNPSEPKNETERAEMAELEKKYAGLIKEGSKADGFRDILIPLLDYDPPPAYRKKWNLAQDPKLQEGVIYMATMNPKEPACFQMLGILCMQKRDRNLAAAAYERAAKLGSPQAAILSVRAKELREFIRKSQEQYYPVYVGGGLIALAIAYFVYAQVRDWRRMRRELKGVSHLLR
jgi:tetratricopeptide (TPR) repeat protein